MLSAMSSTHRVFVVDDDPSARRGLARLLRTTGHDVRDFATAGEFLCAFGRRVSGCVVLDVRLPEMSGVELLAELRARGEHLPIIVISADDDPETRRKARKLNAAGFYRKPVDGTALVDAVGWALHTESAGANHGST